MTVATGSTVVTVVTVVTNQLCTLKNLNLPKTYLLTYLCDSSYSSDSSDSSDISTVVTVVTVVPKKNFFHKKKMFTKKFTKKISQKKISKRKITKKNFTKKKFAKFFFTKKQFSPENFLWLKFCDHRQWMRCTCSSLLRSHEVFVSWKFSCLEFWNSSFKYLWLKD